jgi:dTDP-4-dehydrorhamnose 3,5-epimerase
LEFLPLELPEVILVVPDVHGDSRGFFIETWHEQKYREGGITLPFVQDNHSHSSRGILRGLHAQLRSAQGKLVRVSQGEVFDVAVDVRPGSPNFGRYVAQTLSAENAHQLWIPPGFAHGFCVVSATADFEYKCTAFYDPGDEIAIQWNDPEIGIPWPLDEPALSARDREAPPLAACVERLREGPAWKEST